MISVKKLAILVILGAILVRWIISMKNFLTPPPDFKINDDSCKSAGIGVGMIGSEDSGLGKYGVLFIGSGDLHAVFELGAAAANPGGIWVLDMRPEAPTMEPIKIEINAFPKNRLFQPHGIHVSNTTNRLYAVSHNGDHTKRASICIACRTC